MIISTKNKSFYEWATAVSKQLGIDGTTVPVNEKDDWDIWANKLFMLPQISRRQVARPGFYSDWRTWADAFNQSAEY